MLESDSSGSPAACLRLDFGVSPNCSEAERNLATLRGRYARVSDRNFFHNLWSSFLLAGRSKSRSISFTNTRLLKCFWVGGVYLTRREAAGLLTHCFDQHKGESSSVTNVRMSLSQFRPDNVPRVAVLIACDPRVLQRRLHSDVATGKSLANVNMATSTQTRFSVG